MTHHFPSKDVALVRLGATAIPNQKGGFAAVLSLYHVLFGNGTHPLSSELHTRAASQTRLINATGTQHLTINPSAVFIFVAAANCAMTCHDDLLDS